MAAQSDKKVDALEALDNLVFTSSERKARVEREYQQLRLQVLVQQMREDAGLSQAELAKRIGTQQTAISRIESKGYAGTSLNTLVKIAAATGHRLHITTERRRA